MMRAFGFRALTAVAMPEIRPPPPIGTTTVEISGSDFDHLKADRSLPGDDKLVVKGVDVCVAVFLLQLTRMCDRLVKRRAVKHDLAAEILGRDDLGERGKFGQDDRRFDVEQRGGEGNALRVIAGRGRDDAAFFLFVGEPRDLVIGTANLERAALLQAFGLKMGICTDLTREPLVRDHRRRENDVFENAAGVFDIGEFDGHSYS